MTSGIIETIILAAIALFLVFKLRGVLGTKTGLEEQQGARVRAPAPSRSAPAGPVPVAEANEIDPDSATVAEGDREIGEALSAMRRAEPSFLPSEFMGGARGAFEMILMAFEQGDLDTLRQFLAPEVFAGFEAAIAERRENGYTVDARFIGVREAQVVAARYDAATREAEIAVRFTAEMITVVRDADLQIVEGDPNEIRRESDVWTFGRRMGASDPNWRLVATGG
ncbi:MAG: Tim44/TimA family putative adaptor protein [Rubrimonas sp.]|uniref:Tim44/TimA family putative adaptor protein n=1 Tax=Rubrimonas sp. TaxID=2036015 RepID=UPI002FDD9729